ncbi:Cytochrome P450 [Mycena venus]|uniref:Cytochrome P450 n=1 Tax=Mycena venus TaxID=2733690 RepID=A0A8H6YCQ6_9AGAR|nr:Cytochrome P450 [Mycena venus]
MGLLVPRILSSRLYQTSTSPCDRTLILVLSPSSFAVSPPCHQMLLSIIQYGFLLWISYVFWNALRRLWGGSILDNIPGPPSESVLAGNLARLNGADSWDFHKTLEEDFNAVVKIHGLLGDVQLYVFDPAALHSILVKDQDLYEESIIFLSLTGLLFGKGILSTTGNEHRRHRKIMMPAFSTKNLRGMLPVLYEVAHRNFGQLRDGLIKPHLELNAGPQELDMYSILSRTSLEFIGRAGIGYSFDPLTTGEDPIDQYTQSLKNLTPAIHKLAVFLPIVPLASKIGPPSFRRFMLSLIPSKTLGILCKIVAIMDSKATALVRDKNQTIRHGDADAMENSNDVVSLLLKSNSTADENMKFMDDELVAQTSMIIHAGTETTSSALNRIIHVLALHPDVQTKLRAEIMETKEILSHDELVALPYLDAVIRETLRLYPPITAMTRSVTQDCILPLSTPITGIDGRTMDAIAVPKGTERPTTIRTSGGEDALEFNPERWRNGQARGVTVRMSGVYGNMMTFVGGGRSCIGFKFVQLELKVVLSVLLRCYHFSVASDAIRWKMGSPAAPSVDNRPLLPIVVDRVKA